jgi:predicted CXXCH cytochrome family protein
VKSWRTFGFSLLCALVLMSGMPDKVWSLEIIYPQDGTYVTKSNYLIITGGSDPLLDSMMIEIDGIKSDILDLSSEEYRSLYGDKLIVEPIFDPGENTIVVEGYLRGDKIASAKASVYYQADETKPLPSGYRKDVFHIAAREEKCTACHNMQPTKAQLQDPSPTSNPCAGCHMRMLNRAHVHGPAGVYECSYCHDVESQPTSYRVRLDDANLCQECHEGQGQQVDTQPLLHGPVAAGMCLICHDPHASDQPYLLISEVNQLCLGCHDSVRDKPHVTSAASSSTFHPIAGPVNPRIPEQPLNCASCHNPHGGKNEKYFVGGITVGMALCQQCHNK